MEAIDLYLKRLINQIWKLIPMRENGEDWKKQLSSVIIEISGYSDNQELLNKLKGLSKEETEFYIYRKTVFECIGLLRGQ